MFDNTRLSSASVQELVRVRGRLLPALVAPALVALATTAGAAVISIDFNVFGSPYESRTASGDLDEHGLTSIGGQTGAGWRPWCRRMPGRSRSRSIFPNNLALGAPL